MKKQNDRSACAIKTSIGGQALMEGIMMRGPEKTALAVRNPEGKIVVEEFKTKGTKRPRICRLPIIRGIFGYIDSMTVGYQCLMRSAEIAGLDDVVEESPRKKKKRLEREAKEAERSASAEPEATPVTEPAEPAAVPEESPAEVPAEEKKPEKEEEKLPAWVMTVLMIFSVVLGVALAIGLFIWIPMFLFDLLAKPFPVLKDTGSDALNSLCRSVFEGLCKIILLVGYMAAISLMKDIRRTFMYHGAEHKTIFCYEAGEDLTVENVRKQRRFHPRCGTSFLILMLLVSIFISFFIDPISIAISGHVMPRALRFAVKFLLIPLIVGLGYELIKFAGRHDNVFTRVISAPGMWLQHITVFEPTDDMIECAIAAVKEVIPNDGSDRW